MTKTVQEKQDLINAKDWDALVKTDLFLDFDDRSITFEQYTFDSDFMVSFVFNEERFSDHTAHIFASTGKVHYPSVILSNVMKRVSALGIKFSTKEWKEIASGLCDLFEAKRINAAAVAGNVRITGKDVEFLRVLADDDLYKRLSGIAVAGITAGRLDANEFAKLSPDEQEKVALRLTYGQRAQVYIDNGDMTIFASAVKSPQKINNLAYLLATDVSKILADLEPSEYLQALFKLIDDKVNVRIESWLTYFHEHQDFELNETQLKKLLDYFGGPMFNFMTDNLTDKMVMDNILSISVENLIKRDSLTLDKIVEILGPRRVDLCGQTRFFTEEEIVKFPHFFDPASLNRKPYFYVSRDTFKVLNESWGTKHRYNGDLVDFSAITAALVPTATTIKTLRYLKEKTNASNEVVVKAIDRKHIDEDWSKDAKKLSIIKKFLLKLT